MSADGTEFLSYARQIIEQTELMELRYTDKKPAKQLCSVSTQHYAFAVNAFVNLIASLDAEEYEFTLRETRTYEIIEDVANYRSEVGVLYFSDFNEKVLQKLLQENQLEFTPLFHARPHVFISAAHPLAGAEEVTLEDLESYPFLTFEQGTYNSFYFSEEILSTEPHRKIIHVSDRATLFNLLIGLNGYTICTGVLNSDLNGDNIVSVKLKTDEVMRVGLITNKKAPLELCRQKLYRGVEKTDRGIWISLFCSSSRILSLCSKHPVYRFIYLCGYVRVIHGIQMNPVNPLCRQIYDLVCRVGDTRIAHCFRIMLVALHHCGKLAGQMHTAQRYHALNLLFIDNRHDPRLVLVHGFRPGNIFP